MRHHARTLRRNQTDAEQRIWRHIRNRRLGGYKFRRQAPIGPYIADFVCFERNLIVELDGGQHLDQGWKDARRTVFLESRGFSVVRFWDNEVLRETDKVLGVIFDLLNTPSSPALLPKGEG